MTLNTWHSQIKTQIINSKLIMEWENPNFFHSNCRILN